MYDPAISSFNGNNMNKLLITGFFLFYICLNCYSQTCAIKIFAGRNDMITQNSANPPFFIDGDKNESKSDTCFRVYFKLVPLKAPVIESKKINFKIVNSKNHIVSEAVFQLVHENGLDSCLDIPKGQFDIRAYDENNRLLAKSDSFEVTFSPERQSDIEEQKIIEARELIVSMNIKSGDSVYYPFVRPYSECYITVSSTSENKTTDDIYVYIDYGIKFGQVSLTNIKSSRNVEFITADERARTFEALCLNSVGISISTRNSDNNNSIKICLRGQ